VVVRRLVIADSHLGQREGDTAAMEGLLDAARLGGVEEIVYLGDACQYLIGMSKFWLPATREVLQAWARARAAGVRISVVEGNRDFFLDEADLRPYVSWSGRRYEVEAGARKVRFEHGDRLNRVDLQYHFWAWVSKSGPARLWARLLPRSTAVRIVTSMEARLTRTNWRFRYRKPVKALTRTARRAWAEGVDLMLWGHFHTPWEIAEGSRMAMVVPAWLATRQSLLLEEDGTWLLVDVALTPAGESPRID